jgi:outer membrane immunogenic protein
MWGWMIKRWMGSVAVLPAVVAGSALAAPPTPVPYNWTGFYLGANAGGTWGRFGTSTTVDCNTLTPGFNPYFCSPGFPGDSALLNRVGTGAADASGFTGGFQAGYNWQTGNIVTGIEGDVGAFRLRGTRQASGTLTTNWAGTNFTITNSASTDWLVTLRGRLGVAIQPNLLGYLTGGLAVTRIGITAAYADNNPAGAFAPGISTRFGGDATKVGFTIGAGVEYALPSNWTVKAEYLYLDFGNVAANGAILTSPLPGGYRQGLNTTTDLTAHVARVGINRRF